MHLSKYLEKGIFSCDNHSYLEMSRTELDTYSKRIENTPKALGIDNSYLQTNDPILYHYTKFNIAKIILSNATLKFGDPNEFEDKKDMDLSLIKFETSKSSYIRSYIKSNPDIPYNNILRISLAYDRNPYFYIKDYENLFKDLKSKTGVACFTHNYFNKHLWEEYAENHKGVCIALRASALGSALKSIYFSKVHYAKEPLVANFFDENIEALVHWVLIKNVELVDEEEIRAFAIEIEKHCISMDKESKDYRCVPFDKNGLEAVYLGADMSDDNRQELISLIQEIGYPTTVHSVKKIYETNTPTY